MFITISLRKMKHVYKLFIIAILKHRETAERNNSEVSKKNSIVRDKQREAQYELGMSLIRMEFTQSGKIVACIHQ